MKAISQIFRNRRSTGFTLVELLTVMILMILIMTASVVSWNSLKRGAEMRTAINDVRSSLALARQYAVLKKMEIRICIPAPTNPPPNYSQTYYITNESAGGGLMRGGIQELPLGVQFGNKPLPLNIVFRPNGSVNQNHSLILEDILNTNNTRVLNLNGLTGIIDYD